MDAVTDSVAGRPRGDPYAPCREHFLRAEGFPKRRCQFESVAAPRHLIPRRPADCDLQSAKLQAASPAVGLLFLSGTAYFFFLRWTMRASSAQSKKYGSVA